MISLGGWTRAGLILLLAGCSDTGNEPPPPTAGLVMMRAMSAGDGQSGTVAVELPDPIRVLVLRGGQPEADVTVAWTASGPGAVVAPASSSTDAQGIAAARWTLGQTAGPATAMATVPGASGSPVSFGATAGPGAATQLAAAGGNNQTAPPAAQLATPLQVRATDLFGNPVPGVAIAWQATDGGGSVSPATSMTNAAGLASTTFTLGAIVGPQSAQATAAGLAGSPVLFGATATEPPAGGSSVIVGNNFFDPATRAVPAGTRVIWTWTNTGQVAHSVESTGAPSFPSSSVLTGSGQTYGHTFASAGTYTYICGVHGASMSGTIVVQ